MKSYKLVNSKDVQEKAFRLGYGWINGGEKIVQKLKESFLYLDEIDGVLTYDSSPEYFTEYKCEEITQADFLALPELLKFGNWVKTDDSRGVMIAKITWISEDGQQLETFGNSNWCIEPYQCTRLTPEQIKVLGLED